MFSGVFELIVVDLEGCLSILNVFEHFEWRK